ncbi:hypothetical protein MKX01_000602 [Papaver californicum]|nr:hypothetical protein MKX01_000602 [Papaver californicum]
MPLKSLNLHLRDLKPGKEPLDWTTRMKIAQGTAKALEYLHDKKDPPVIYSGLKSTSILLDENYNPKLSDFSCGRHGPKCFYVAFHTKLLRRFGYIGLEYINTGYLTLESDVFGFGVVLLELISGEKHTRPLLEDSKKFPGITDPLMKGQYPHRGLVQALDLAKMCVQEEPHERPRIAEVVTTLSNLVSQIYEEAHGTTEADPFTPLTM